jgi:hypothetical protein
MPGARPHRDVLRPTGNKYRIATVAVFKSRRKRFRAPVERAIRSRARTGRRR